MEHPVKSWAWDFPKAAWLRQRKGIFFTKFWNRKCAKLTHRLINIFFHGKKGKQCFLLILNVVRWGVYQYNPQEEYPRPEYLAHLAKIDTEQKLNPVTRTKEPVPPFWCMKVNFFKETFFS